MRAEPSLPRRAARPAADAPVAELADGVAIGKAWLLALLAAAPLEAAGSVPVAALSSEGPALVAALLRALGSDRELERLAPGGDLAPLAARAGALAGAVDPAAAVAAVEALRACAWHELAAELRTPDARLVGDLADRLAHVCSVVAQAAAGAAGARSAGHATLDDGGARPAAVIAVEVDDAERLLAAQPAPNGDGPLERAERAVTGALGPADRMTREGPGRYRVTSPGADGAGARALGERIAAAVAAAAAPRSIPLTVSVGVAAWPQDGDAPEDLRMRADERMFAARAAGVPLLD